MADHYSVLGVAVDFSPEELKARYKKQSNAKTDDDWAGVHTSTMHSKFVEANATPEESPPL